jgi:hypothetical protein
MPEPTVEPKQRRRARVVGRLRQQLAARDRRIHTLEQENDLLRRALNQPQPAAVEPPPLTPRDPQPAPNGLVLGALVVPEPCPHNCAGTLNHVAADTQFHRYICDTCQRITTKPIGATT